MLQNEPSVAKIGFDVAENEPSKVWVHGIPVRVELQKGTESAKGTGEVDGALEGSSVVEWRCSF